VITLLKYIEDNSLTGELDLSHNGDDAKFFFKKGQLVDLSYKDLNETEAMDEILAWKEGEFIIKPDLFRLNSDETVATPAKDQTAELFRNYLAEKIEEFNQFAGLQVTKNALRQSFHKFKDYFDVVSDIEIESTPEVKVLIKNNNWSEKHTLFSAILLRDLVTTIERDVIGIEFWSPGSSNTEMDEQLQKISFFEYYEQATDFIRV
jgi:hypothetical protein